MRARLEPPRRSCRFASLAGTHTEASCDALVSRGAAWLVPRPGIFGRKSDNRRAGNPAKRASTLPSIIARASDPSRKQGWACEADLRRFLPIELAGGSSRAAGAFFLAIARARTIAGPKAQLDPLKQTWRHESDFMPPSFSGSIRPHNEFPSICEQ